MNPKNAALYIPPGLKKFKLELFERIGAKIQAAGGRAVRDNENLLDELPLDVLPIIGCTPTLRPLVLKWQKDNRPFVYWDRGYARRVFATWLPRGEDGGYYRWHINAFQMQSIAKVPDDRWKALNTAVGPWQKGGKHILIAAPTFNYAAFHGIEKWTDQTVDALARVTNRPLMVRGKESKRPLAEDLKGAHAIVSHGSNAAVEAVIMGYPAFVSSDSAAALLGNIDLAKIETPQYPERHPWLNALAYSQWNERELVDGTLWRLLA